MVEIILGIGSFELSLGEAATFDDISGFLPTDRVEGLDEALSDKADKADVYTKGEVDTRLDSKANASEVYTKSETDGLLGDKANASEVYTKSETNTLLDNKANVSDLANKQNTLTAGDNITIVDDVISASGSVDDVQINGTSIVVDKVANIPYASEGVYGVTTVTGEEVEQIKEDLSQLSEDTLYREYKDGFTDLSHIPNLPDYSNLNALNGSVFRAYNDESGSSVLDLSFTEDVSNTKNVRYRIAKGSTDLNLIPVVGTVCRLKLDVSDDFIYKEGEQGKYTYTQVMFNFCESTELNNINIKQLGTIQRDYEDGWYYISNDTLVQLADGNPYFYPLGIFIGTSVTRLSKDDFIKVTVQIASEEDITEYGWVSKIDVIRKASEYVPDIYSKIEQITPTNSKAIYDFIGCRPYSIEHRGHKSIAPENTLEAYRLSKQYEFDFVETDLAYTVDNHAVILHDESVDRTSNGTGNISELTFDYVRGLDFSYLNGNKVLGYEDVTVQIPTFEEVVVLCKNIGLYLYIDLKTGLTQEQIENAVNIVAQHNMLRSVTWISAYDNMLLYVIGVDNGARVGIHRATWDTSAINKLKSLRTSENEVFADASLSGLSSSVISSLISNGFAVETYAPNTKEQMIALDNRISGVTSEIFPYNKTLYDSNIGDEYGRI